MILRDELINVFTNKGFQQITNVSGPINVFAKNNQDSIETYILFDDTTDTHITKEQCYAWREKTRIWVANNNGGNKVPVMIMISDDYLKLRSLATEEPGFWGIDADTRYLMIFENQIVQNLELKNEIEETLSISPQKKPLIKYITVNRCLVFANILIFLICTFTGNLLYNIGEFDSLKVLENGEIYRMITCMFLHADINHLFSNMLILFFLGDMMEKRMGHIKYLILYFFSGIGAGIFSLLIQIKAGELYSAVGASGAVFGVMGALLLFLIVNKGKIEEMSIGRFLFYLVASIYMGMRSATVDNNAHIGGLITGFLVALVIQLICYRNKKCISK